MYSLPRWLISITDMPDPCQSSISSAAWRSTGSGRAAGPALKLKTRVMNGSPGQWQNGARCANCGAYRSRTSRCAAKGTGGGDCVFSGCSCDFQQSLHFVVADILGTQLGQRVEFGYALRLVAGE